jgi:hypothetical protein
MKLGITEESVSENEDEEWREYIRLAVDREWMRNYLFMHDWDHGKLGNVNEMIEIIYDKKVFN